MNTWTRSTASFSAPNFSRTVVSDKPISNLKQVWIPSICVKNGWGEGEDAYSDPVSLDFCPELYYPILISPCRLPVGSRFQQLLGGSGMSISKGQQDALLTSLEEPLKQSLGFLRCQVYAHKPRCFCLWMEYKPWLLNKYCWYIFWVSEIKTGPGWVDIHGSCTMKGRMWWGIPHQKSTAFVALHLLAEHDCLCCFMF